MRKFYKILFFFAIFIYMYSLFCIDSNLDKDLWHRLAVGEIFCETGSILKHDIFAYTQVKNLWIDHEWASGVVFYVLSHIFGDNGLIVLNLVLYLAIFIIIYSINKDKNIENHASLLLFYIISATTVYAGFQNFVRSQIFTYLFFTLWIYLLEKIRKSDVFHVNGNFRAIIIFPLTMLLWVNLHGGFVSGIGLILIYLIGQFLNKKPFFIYLIILIFTLPVILINPFGFEFLNYIYFAATMHRPFITEWQPLDLFSDIRSNLTFKILMLITAFGWFNRFIQKTKSIDWTEFILFSITLYLSLKHQRHMVFFAIVTSIFGYKHYSAGLAYIQNLLSSQVKIIFSEKLIKLLSFTFCSSLFIFIIGIGITTVIEKPLSLKVYDNEYPTSAIEFIKVNNLKGNLLVPFNWGSYALWKLYPICKVSIDGRYEETYTDELFKEMMDFNLAKSGWDTVINKYKTDLILVPSESKIFKKIFIHKNWKLIYYDKYSALFAKNVRYKKSLIKPDKNNDYSKSKYITPERNFNKSSVNNKIF